MASNNCSEYSSPIKKQKINNTCEISTETNNTKCDMNPELKLLNATEEDIYCTNINSPETTNKISFDSSTCEMDKIVENTNDEDSPLNNKKTDGEDEKCVKINQLMEEDSILYNIWSHQNKMIHFKSLSDVCRLLNESKNIIVLTGAGVSVSCGIPDFRSRNGIYERLHKEYPNLPDPQAMFDIRYFSKDPRPFYKFAREIYPGQYKPSPCHYFIKKLEERNKLLRNYTQNIDTLEKIVDIRNLIECHGSFATASCTKCSVKVSSDAIREDILEQRIPVCKICNPNMQSPKSCDVQNLLDVEEKDFDENLSLHDDEDSQSIYLDENEINEFGLAAHVMGLAPKPIIKCDLVANGIMKPDIVFFGEGLPEVFHDTIDSDRQNCDLLIVIGSSLKVRPVALIPDWVSPSVPQILINRELLHIEFDISLLGDSDIIINQLCHMMDNDWRDICWSTDILTEAKSLLPLDKINKSLPISDSKEFTDIQDTKTSNHSDEEVPIKKEEPSLIEHNQDLASAANLYMQLSADSGFDSSTSDPVQSKCCIPRTSPSTSMSSSVSNSSNSNCPDLTYSAYFPKEQFKQERDESDTKKYDDKSAADTLPATKQIEKSDGDNLSEDVHICDEDSDSDDNEDSDEFFYENGVKWNLDNKLPSTSSASVNYFDKISISQLLPKGSYFRLYKRNYIFPGAEVFVSRKYECSSNGEDSSSTYSSLSSTSSAASATLSSHSSNHSNSSTKLIEFPPVANVEASKEDFDLRLRPESVDPGINFPNSSSSAYLLPLQLSQSSVATLPPTKKRKFV